MVYDLGFRACEPRCQGCRAIAKGTMLMGLGRATVALYWDVFLRFFADTGTLQVVEVTGLGVWGLP